jgi:hypothetical protein
MDWPGSDARNVDLGFTRSLARVFEESEPGKNLLGFIAHLAGL